MILTLNGFKNDTEEVLDQRYALITPRRWQETQGARIYEKLCIAEHVNIDEIERWLRPIQLEMFRNPHL